MPTVGHWLNNKSLQVLPFRWSGVQVQAKEQESELQNSDNNLIVVLRLQECPSAV